MADETSEHADPVEETEVEATDWEAREQELLALKADDLKAVAAEMELAVSGTKAELAARIIAQEQDDAADDEAMEDLPDLDEELPDEGGVADDGEDVALGDAMADELSDEEAAAASAKAAAEEAARIKAEEDAKIKAAADHERAHGLGVTATPGTVATLDEERLVAPVKPAEAWDTLATKIEADVNDQIADLYDDAKDAATFAAEFAQKLAKYKYKLATARDTFQKRQYEKNLRHLEAQMAIEAARQKIKMVRNGDILLEKILTTTIRTIAGAALGALI